MWDRDKLENLARRRGEGLRASEQALLAFARWQEMTDETGANPELAKKELDGLIGTLSDEEAQRLNGLGDFQRDAVIRDFQMYVFEARTAGIESQVRAVTDLPNWPEQKISQSESPEVELDKQNTAPRRPKRGRRR